MTHLMGLYFGKKSFPVKDLTAPNLLPSTMIRSLFQVVMELAVDYSLSVLLMMESFLLKLFGSQKDLKLNSLPLFYTRVFFTDWMMGFSYVLIQQQENENGKRDVMGTVN